MNFGVFNVVGALMTDVACRIIAVESKLNRFFRSFSLKNT